MPTPVGPPWEAEARCHLNTSSDSPAGLGMAGRVGVALDGHVEIIRRRLLSLFVFSFCFIVQSLKVSELLYFLFYFYVLLFCK